MAEMDIDPNRELNKVFDAEDQNRAEMRGRHVKKEDAKKKAFLNDLIRVVMVDLAGDGRVIPGCDWTIGRKNLTLKILVALIKRCPRPEVQIDYFYDKDGTPFWMEELMLKALPKPCYYIIVPKTMRDAYDVRAEPKYTGQTVFCIKNVPLKAKNEVNVVDEHVLRDWLRFGVMEEDMVSKRIIVEIAKVKEVIKEVDKKVKSVSKLNFTREDGSKMNDEEAEEQRETLYSVYSEERLAAESRLKTKEYNLKAHTAWRRQMGIDFQMGDVDENTDTATWYVKFYGVDDAQEMEDLLVAKKDWPGIKLACGSAEDKWPVWAGRGFVPTGGQSYEPDYTLLQVNVAGARFLRVAHGVGSWKQLDRQSSNIHDDKFHMYYGHWEAGRKFGQGIEFNDAGAFSGRFVNGWRNGHCKWDLADGTAVVGTFAVAPMREEKVNPLFDNPYLEGEPHGQVEVLFSDGGMYRGMMRNGSIEGPGEYQSAFGELIIGNFHNGILTGENGYIKNIAGEQYKGKFVEGEIDGLGDYQNDRGDTYQGYFEMGLRHGRGVVRFKGRGFYRGYYINGFKSGKGELAFGKRRKKKDTNKAKANVNANSNSTNEKDKGISENAKGKPVDVKGSSKASSASSSVDAKKEKSQEEKDKEELAKRGGDPEFKFLFQGFFLANSVVGGGILMDTISQLPKVVSRRDHRALYPITQVMKKEERTNKGIKRNLERLSDMEHFIRDQVVKKKSIMFKQQKHFTKKSMYAEDTYGGIHTNDLRARNLVRTDRLERTDPGKYSREKALVPHLRMHDDTPVNSLLKSFKKIKPDPDYGDVRRVKKLMTQLAVSDFDELKERQRLLKYDLLWQRAEQAFAKKKKG